MRRSHCYACYASADIHAYMCFAGLLQMEGASARSRRVHALQLSTRLRVLRCLDLLVSGFSTFTLPELRETLESLRVLRTHKGT